MFLLKHVLFLDSYCPKLRVRWPLCLIPLIYACSTTPTPFDLQGHRGARGLMPENSIPGFIKAIKLGVNTLEMDLAVTQDHQLILSHEPYMSAMICLDSAGNAFPEEEQQEQNIYQMTYQEVAAYDCGSKPHPWFPDQQKMKVHKPLLVDVIDTVVSYAQINGLEPLRYNIEIKSQAATDRIFHPEPQVFSDLVYRTLDSLINWELVTIQSFDFRVLQYFRRTYPHVTLALLIENDLPIQQNLDSLGFIPDLYSCHFPLLSQQSVKVLQSKSISVIPWTVNEQEDMDRLLAWGVDGLITDYPNRFKRAKE